MIERFLVSLTRTGLRWPWLTLLTATLLAAASLFYTQKNLVLESSQASLLSQEHEYNKRYTEYTATFPELDNFVFAIENKNKNLSQTIRAGGMLAGLLEKDTKRFKSILWRLEDAQVLSRKGLYFLSEKETGNLERLLKESWGDLKALSSEPTLTGLFNLLSKRTSFFGREKDSGEGLGLERLKKVLTSLEEALDGKPIRSPWKNIFDLPEAKEDDRLSLSENKRFLFITVEPLWDRVDEFRSTLEITKKARGYLSQCQKAFPDIEMGLTGRLVLGADEMEAADRDIRLVTLFSLLGLALLYIWLLRGFVHPVVEVGCLSIGVAWAFGMVTATLGHFNLFSIIFAPILIGIADDFGVHFIARFQEIHSKITDTRAALLETTRKAGRPIFISALTTSGAFYTAMFVEFKGIAELGFVAGTGLLVCWLAFATALPAMLLLAESFRKPQSQVHAPGLPLFWISGLSRRRGVILSLCGLTLLLSAILMPRVQFDSNLLHLQPKGVESARWEDKLIREAGRSTWFGLLLYDSVDEAWEKKKSLERLKTVEAVEGLPSFLPENQAGRKRRMRKILAALGEIPFAPASEDLSLEALAPLMGRFHKNLKAGRAFSRLAGESDQVRKLEGVLKVVERIQGKMSEIPPERVHQRLLPFQKLIFPDLQSRLRKLLAHLAAEPVVMEDIPQIIQRYYIGKTGKILLQIFPKGNLWEEEDMERFIKDIRGVDLSATGSPVQVWESSRLLKNGFQMAGLYCLIAVFILAAIDFKSPLMALLSLIPVGAGLLWMLGVMWLFGIAFNPANLMALPIIIGIGVDSGIHMIHRWIQEGKRAEGLLAESTARAVILSNLTTIVSFGMLAFARHQGMKSLGLLLAIGLTLSLLAALLLLPALLSKKSSDS